MCLTLPCSISSSNVAERLVERRVRIVGVGVVEVDVVGLQALERLVDGDADVAGRQSRAVGLALPTLVASTTDVAVAARGEPLADHRLGLAADVAGRERGVGVGGVDEVAARRDVGVEHRERVRARRPSSRTRCRRGRAGTRRGRSVPIGPSRQRTKRVACPDDDARAAH